MPTLVLLESPAKIKKISKLLGDGYIVKATYGHIRDLDKKKLSIDVNNNYKPSYYTYNDKKSVINDIKNAYKSCDNVLLASDYDREGEAIAWHISEILKIPIDKRKRLLFTEITKRGIENGLKNLQDLDINTFYAQQARRISDRLIGWSLTPQLWKHIQSSMKKGQSLSAGRVQSVVNKLILERENEIKQFESSSYYKTIGNFNYKNVKFYGELNTKFNSKSSCEDFLETAANCDFIIKNIKKTISKRNPSPPFITSSLQQEASNKYKISPKKTMEIAQKLYENGLITYMRTDSVIISEDILDVIESKIKETYGEEYSNRKSYKTKSKNSQEAHEAIRPCNFDINTLVNDDKYNIYDSKIYNLIYKRTLASQMSACKMEINNITIMLKDENETLNSTFNSKNEKMLFDGFTKIYKPYEETDEDSNTKLMKNEALEKLKVNDKLNMKNIVSSEKFTKPPHLRFTEASLIKKLEELGIGRPSTYSSMISTVQERKYVEKKDKEGVEKKCNILKLQDFTIEESTTKTLINGEKQKLFPTQIGVIVNDFLTKHFEHILDYKFTANIEKNLDLVSQGNKSWVNIVDEIYKTFSKNVEKLNKSNPDKYNRILGTDPKTKFEVITYIAKYGPVVQLKNTKDPKKSKFAPLKDIKMEDVTLEQALELLKYPYVICKVNDKNVEVCKGKYGIYLKYNNQNISIFNSENIEEKLNSDFVENIINSKLQKKPSNIIKTINKDIIIKNGKFGNYICYKDKTNIKIYSKKKVTDLTLEDCNLLIKKYFDYKKNKK